MTTYLDGLEMAERWLAWDDAKEFILVQDPEGHRVMLSRWDVHAVLESATMAAFSSPGTGAAAIREKVFVQRAGGHGAELTELVIQRPCDAGQWIAELVGLARAHGAAMGRFYRVGPWVFRLDTSDYYAHLHGATREDLLASAPMNTERDNYQAMFNASSSCADRTAVVMKFLAGEDVPSVPAEMARLTVAMCVSEAARNHRTWGINLMLMDLLRSNMVKGGWSSVIADRLHPMAKGSTFEHGRVGMGGGRKSRETWAHETSITMLWLNQFGGMSISPVEEVDRRWRDPVKGEVHGNTVRRRLMGRILTRMQRVGFVWEE